MMEAKSEINNTHPSSLEWGSDIVLKSTPKKTRRRRSTPINPNEKEIIKTFEEGLEKSLTEKAAKSNLSKVAVKSILKYVVTDENVLALMKHKENDEDLSEVLTYEPKITRSKSKQLSNCGSSLIHTLDQATPNDSKVHELLTADLQEESSDDEYVPGEDESEDDSFCYTISNPPTPCTTKQNHLDTEVFKTPELKGTKLDSKYDDDDQLIIDDANIALRTRSKLSLNQTPLEKLEQSFIPPDITHDMYEFECNDDDWKDFLSSFNQPLDEVFKNTEEEDLDPEYNILSDEEITKVDTEELRDDRAVRVPKRELNDLIAELFEYVDIYEKRKDFRNDSLDINIDPNSYSIQQKELDRYIEIFDGATNKQIQLDLDENVTIFGNEEIANNDVITDEENCLNNLFSKLQLQLLVHQMTQHVQMLIQNFLLTYNHPHFNEDAYVYKEYLINFKLLSKKNDNLSVFNTINLEKGIELVENWERKFLEATEEATSTIEQFNEVMEESIDCFNKGQHYYLPIPDSILKTISESEVFIYPQLLPKIPFMHPELQDKQPAPFTTSEKQLIALGLEQFIQVLMNDKEFMTNRNRINMRKIAEVIKKMLMTSRKIHQIYRTIREQKKWKDVHNPISFYFKNKRAPFTVHHVIDLNEFGILPPNKRSADLLPRQWRRYIHQDSTHVDFVCRDSILSLPPKKLELKRPTLHRRIVPKSAIPKINIKTNKSKHVPNTQAIKKFRRGVKKAIPFVKYLDLVKSFYFLTKYFSHLKLNQDSYAEYTLSLNMLPSMPCIGLSEDLPNIVPEEAEDISSKKAESESLVNDKENLEGNVKTENLIKDNCEDISALLTSSPIKNTKKEPNLVDKKKAKKRREFHASIAMLAPPVPEVEKEKREQFSKEYIKKLRETLSKSEFSKVMALFLGQTKGDAVDFYKELMKVLVPKYQDLADEFLLFLTVEQAQAVGELIPFFIMNHMMKFLRYLELYFKDQPSQLRKVYKSLQELNDTPDVNLERIKSAILPLLKSNPLLCDSFLQLFLEESPTATLLNGGAWDVIDVNKELNRAKEEGAFEIIAVTEEDPSCTCVCHKTDPDQPQKQHCNNCGLKFIQGKIYCQTSKGMKPVNVSFPLDPDIDHNARLSVPNKIRKVDLNSNKSSTLGGNKDMRENNQTYVETDLDGRKRKIRVCKPIKKSSPRQKKLKKKEELEDASEKPISRSPSKKKTASQKTSIQADTEKAEEVIPITDSEWRNLPSPEYMSVPLSDSESSQEDDKTLTNIVEEVENDKDVDEKNNKDIEYMKADEKNEDQSNESIMDTWTREEDRILLETYKQNFNKDPITLIKQRLPHRTDEEIRSRFDNLMNLLQEMYSRGDSKISNS